MRSQLQKNKRKDGTGEYMEERSLRVYSSEKTFFSKITNTLTKLLIPTKVSLNGMMISMKRNNVLKAYENSLNVEKIEDENRREAISKKVDDTYALYLESIDKYIMDSIYKKVKNDTASEFEKEALSQYYMITHLKETGYTEYKYKKQMYLMRLDYETVSNEKTKILEKYKKFYAAEMEILYKGLLKHYSIRLADNISDGEKQEIYNKIFKTLEEYISNILPIKMELDNNDTYKEILDGYNEFERFTVGKLDQNDNIEKNMILLGISRKLFTHSLPLVVAEQCYIKLLKDARSLIVDTKIAKKQQKAYSLLINIMEEYNVRLLSTKIYWDKPSQREEYKAFWNEYKKVNELKDSNYDEYIKQKEILFVESDLKKVSINENKYYKIIKFYKNRLVELGAMRKLMNSYSSDGKYTKVVKNEKKKKSKKEKVVV